MKILNIKINEVEVEKEEEKIVIKQNDASSQKT